MKNNANRRPLVIGPGVVIAIIATVWFWPQLAPPKPQVSPAQTATRIGLSAPEPEWILQQAKQLQLSSSQKINLQKLRDRWNRDTRQLRAELQRATAQFNDDGRAASLPELQNKMAPVSQLSRQLNDARRLWWNEARQTLNAAQQKRAEELWANRFRHSPEDKP
jgi:hypothetical protein